MARGGSMNQGKLVFAQLMQHLPLTTFRRCVARYHGEFKVQSLFAILIKSIFECSLHLSCLNATRFWFISHGSMLELLLDN
jgi:hypothetical protein